MRESIRGYTEAVIEEVASDLPQLADELSGFSGLLASSGDLRSVLSDPGLPIHARRGVVTDLLSDRFSAGAVRLLTQIIEVDRATNFDEDVTWVAGRVVAARDGLVPIGDGPLGRTTAAERIDGYATAVLESVRADDAFGDVEDELFRFARIIDGSDELRAALTDRELPVEVRHGLVRDLVASKVSIATERLVGYAARVGRPRDYLELLAAVTERVAEESHRQVAEVRAAVALTDAQERRLAAALSRIIGHQIDVRVIVDAGVLGGFVASIGDAVVDGSTRHRLEQLKDRLVLPEATVTTGP